MSLVRAYYAAIDAGDLESATGMLTIDVEFSLQVPTGEVRGRSRCEMLEYLRRRPPVERRHVVLRSGVDRDLEFAHGHVSDDGVVTGWFTAVMHVVSPGAVDRYSAWFSPDFRVVPNPPGDATGTKTVPPTGEGQ